MGPKYFLMLICNLSVLSACSQDTFEKKLDGMYKETVPLIKPQQLVKWEHEGEQLIILDTRSNPEYQVSHLQNARFIDFDTFNRSEVEDVSKTAKIVVYCSVGYRSERIGEKLQQMGFKEVYNLYGGIFHWKNNSYPVVNSNGQSTDSVHAYNRAWGRWLQKGIKVYD